MRVPIGGPPVHRESGIQEAACIVEMAPLEFEHAQQVQRVEVAGRVVEDRAVAAFCLDQITRLVEGNGALDSFRNGFTIRQRRDSESKPAQRVSEFDHLEILPARTAFRTSPIGRHVVP